jgi:glycosyltransferase involved in cell wall biosynthesis
MRVLHVITDLDIGGTEIMLWQLVAAGVCNASDSTVVSLTDDGPIGARLRSLGVSVCNLGMRRRAGDLLRLRTLAPLVRRMRPQLIQGWMYHGNLAASVAGVCDTGGAPVLWSVRQSLHEIAAERRTTKVAIRLGALLSRHAVSIIYNSETAARQHEALGYHGRRSVVIPNGFDCDRFRPSADARRRIRAELGIAEDAVCIGLVGRLHPVKDHDSFLRAASVIARRHQQACFVMAGLGVTAQEPSLTGLISAAGLAGRVRLLGVRADMPAVNAALDVACSSSRNEGFANVIGEAMACGVPCVVTDVGDGARVVGATGIVVQPRAPEALAEGINRLIDLGASGRHELGAAARRRVLAEYPLQTAVQRYRELYERAVASASVMAAASAAFPPLPRA